MEVGIWGCRALRGFPSNSPAGDGCVPYNPSKRDKGQVRRVSGFRCGKRLRRFFWCRDYNLGEAIVTQLNPITTMPTTLRRAITNYKIVMKVRSILYNGRSSLIEFAEGWQKGIQLLMEFGAMSSFRL